MRRLGLFVVALAIFAIGETLVAQRGDWPSTKAVQALKGLIDAAGDITTFTLGASPSMIYLDADSLAFRDTSSDHVITFADVPDLTGSDSTEALVTIAATLGIMDAGDTQYAVFADITSADHTGGSLFGSYMLNDVEDADAFEGAYYASAEWDGHYVMQSLDASPSDNPPAGAGMLYLDDNTDWSGGGGNDCSLVLHDAGGNTVVVATVVLNGACP